MNNNKITIKHLRCQICDWSVAGSNYLEGTADGPVPTKVSLLPDGRCLCDVCLDIERRLVDQEKLLTLEEFDVILYLKDEERKRRAVQRLARYRLPDGTYRSSSSHLRQVVPEPRRGSILEEYTIEEQSKFIEEYSKSSQPTSH